MTDKPIYVTFVDKKTERTFEELKDGKYEDKQLYEFIGRAMRDLKQKPSCGIKLPQKLWPREYLTKNIANLWKYDLPNAWRLIYTIKTDEVMILNVILEWFDHKDYEKRFKY